MDEKYRKDWRPCVPGPKGLRSSLSSDCLPWSSAPDVENKSPAKGGITFGSSPGASEHAQGGVPSPRVDVPGPMMKTVRDPALLLTALSGVDPSGPVMVEVPLVLNNSAFTRSQELAGWRIGFANRYVGASDMLEHSAAFVQALNILRSAGALLVPLDAQRVDLANQFTLGTRNEIDERVGEYHLDAIVCESKNTAFHGACESGSAGMCELLEGGTMLWFYAARWAGERLRVLVGIYRQLLQQSA